MMIMIAVILILAATAVTYFVFSSSATPAPEAVPAGGVGAVGYSDSSVYDALSAKLKTCGADGYAVCRLAGCTCDTLVLSFTDGDHDGRYEFYSIDRHGIAFLGQLNAAYNTLYIDRRCGKLGVFSAVSGKYSYGLLRAENGIVVDYRDSGTVKAGESYPDFPGEEVAFFATRDKSLILNSDKKD